MRVNASLVPVFLLSILGLAPLTLAQVKVQPGPPARPQQTQSQTVRQAQTGEIGKYSGPGSCSSSNCHGSVLPKNVVRISQNEYSIWAAQDKHARAYSVLSNTVSIRMGKILGLEQPPDKSQKCLDCHALNVKPELRAQTFQTIEDGVSCESCHGPAVGWLGAHTLRNWTHQQSLNLGMYDTRDLVKRTEICLTCHLGTEQKQVDHVMIAAGHPDLTFQLVSFSSAMPRHWNRPADAGPWLSVRELAVGQAVQLREALNRLYRRASGPNWPEFGEYECFACHHSLTKPEDSWRQAAGYPGREPGAPVWNPSTYAVFRYVAVVVDPSTTNQLLSELGEIEQLSGKPGSKDQLARQAKNAAGLADQMVREVQAQTFGANLTAQLLQAIANDSQTISMAGERSAEQAAMSLDSLTLAYTRNEQVANQAELRAAISDLFRQLNNPSAYNAPRFEAQMQKVAEFVSQAHAGTSGRN